MPAIRGLSCAAFGACLLLGPAPAVRAQVSESQARNAGRGHPWQTPWGINSQDFFNFVNPYSRARQTSVRIDPFSFRSNGDISVNLSFHHNSMAAYSNPNMAPKWSHTYDTHLDVWNDGMLKAAVVWGDHTVHLFGFDGAAWDNTDGYRHTLAPSGMNYTLTLKSHLVYEFEPSGTAGRYRLKSIQDSNANTLSFTYDAMGRLWKVTAPDATAANARRRLQFVYNATTGKLTSVKFVAGSFNRIAKVSYNATTGRLTQITLPTVTVNTVPTIYRVKFTTNPSQNITKVTDQDGNAWTFGYSGDACTSVQWPKVNPTDPALPPPITYSVPGANQVRVTDAAGVATTYQYDGLSRLVTSTLNSGHSITRTWSDPDYAWLPDRLTLTGSEEWLYDYDGRGNLLAITPPGLGRFDYAYDAFDRVVRIEQPLVTDAYGMADPARRRRDFLYDSAHNLTAVRRFTNAVNFVETMYTYDTRGNLVSAVNPLMRTTMLMRDDYGNLKELRTPEARRTIWTFADRSLTHGFTRPQAVEIAGSGQGVGTFAYDEWGRLVQSVFPDGSGATWAYNGRGRLTAVADPSGTTSWAYTAAGLLLSETRGPYSVAHGYLSNGLRSSRTENGPAGVRAVTFDYDAMNRLWHVREGAAVHTFTYDALGRLAQAIASNNARSDYTYTGGRLDTISHLDGMGVPLAFIDYGYQANGRRASKMVSGALTNYDYDMLGRLVREERPGLDDFVWTYDAADQLATETRNGMMRAFMPDLDGLLLSATDGVSTWTYTYDAAGRCRTRDANGTMWKQYAYDFQGRLVGVDSSANGQSWSPFRRYSYDGLGRRLTRDRLDPNGTVASTRTFRYDGERLWGSELFTTVLTPGPLTWGPGRLLAYRDHATGGTYFPMSDADGTAAAYTDGQGMSVGFTGIFNAFGRQVAPSSPNPEHAWMADGGAARESDGADGLTTLGGGSRWYDPENQVVFQSGPGPGPVRPWLPSVNPLGLGGGFPVLYLPPPPLTDESSDGSGESDDDSLGDDDDKPWSGDDWTPEAMQVPDWLPGGIVNIPGGKKKEGDPQKAGDPPIVSGPPTRPPQE